MPRQLTHRQFYELCLHLRDNAKKIVDTRLRAEEVAADATMSLKFLVTKANAKKALGTVGIELVPSRMEKRIRDSRPIRTLARALIKFARELNYEVGEEVYWIAGRGAGIAAGTEKPEKDAMELASKRLEANR